jgi:hypothetical protein
MQARALAAAFAATLLLALPFATPAPALTAKEKMETCKFGAEDQQLTGKKASDFVKKCMANEPAAKSAAKKAAPAAKATPASAEKSK